MRLERSRSKLAIELNPDVLLPTERLTATVSIAERIDRVRDARVELGYVNAYRYRWAGRNDPALRQEPLSVPTAPTFSSDASSSARPRPRARRRSRPIRAPLQSVRASAGRLVHRCGAGVRDGRRAVTSLLRGRFRATMLA